MPPDHVIISHSASDYTVGNASPIPTNEDVSDFDEKNRKKMQAALAKQKTIQTTYNSEVDPDPKRAFELEHKIDYTNLAKCKFCSSSDNVVFRLSDTIYSPKLGRDKSVLTKNSYPIHVPIDSVNTARDRFGNYQQEFTGEVVPHICPVEKMGSDDFRRFVEAMYEQQIEFQRQVLWEQVQLRKDAVLKEFRVDNVTYQEV
jgi:hypothetical protein